MTRYGCWDCGSEVAPFQGRCVVCGWPAPPPRPRRRRWPMTLFLIIVVSTVAVGAFFVGSEGPRFLLGSARKSQAAHRWFQPNGAICGNSIRCKACGASRFSTGGAQPCPYVRFGSMICGEFQNPYSETEPRR